MYSYILHPCYNLNLNKNSGINLEFKYIFFNSEWHTALYSILEEYKYW